MIDIKEATQKDIVVIQAIAQVAFPDTYKEILSKEQLAFMLNWMYSTESLTKQINDGHHFFLAYRGDEALGFVSIRKESANLYHLEKLYVLPASQGLQLGKLLFKHALDTARKMNDAPCEVHLNVNRHNKALGFYQHMGMHKVSQGDFDIGHGYYMNDYIMGIEV